MSARLVRAARRVVEEARSPVHFSTMPGSMLGPLLELEAALPRKRGDRGEAKRTKRKERANRMAEIRAKVIRRAQGHCEVCATGRAEEAHHLISGPLRRVRESVDTVLAVCGDCHHDMHSGELDTLQSAQIYAESCGMHEAAAALARRIDKIHEARR